MAFQHLLAFVNPEYVSISSYATSLEVKSLTKSKLVTEWLGRVQPGAYTYQSLQNHVYSAAKDWSYYEHGIPIGAVVVAGADNCSVNYVEKHSRSNALLEKTKGSYCWTTRAAFIKTHPTKSSSQLNPANSPAVWRTMKPFANCSRNIFLPNHPLDLRQRTRPEGSKSDEDWRKLFDDMSFDETKSSLFGEMDYELQKGLSHIQPKLLRGIVDNDLDSDDEDPTIAAGQRVEDPSDVVENVEEVWPGGKQPRNKPKVCFPCRRYMPILPGKCTYCKEQLLTLDEMREQYGNANLLNVYREKKQYQAHLAQSQRIKTYVFNQESNNFLLVKSTFGAGAQGPSSGGISDYDPFSVFGSRAQDDPEARFYMQTLPCAMVNPARVAAQKLILNEAAEAFNLVSKAL